MVWNLSYTRVYSKKLSTKSKLSLNTNSIIIIYHGATTQWRIVGYKKTAAILERLPPSTFAGMQVLVDQVSPLRDLASVQKSVTKRLQKENEKLRNRLEKLEENVDETEQHGRNINLVLKCVPEDANSTQREDTTSKFVNTLSAHSMSRANLLPQSHRLDMTNFRAALYTARRRAKSLLPKIYGRRKEWSLPLLTVKNAHTCS